MSLVIYCDGALYADTKAWGGEGNVPSPGTKHKVNRMPNGDLVGVTSALLGMTYKAVKAYREGREVVDGGDFRGIVIKAGVPGYFYWSDDTPMTGPFRDRYYAVGSGAKYALGALDAGASVKEAFDIAARRDYFTDRKFRTYRP